MSDEQVAHEQRAAALAMAASIRTELRTALQLKFDDLPANLKWLAVFQELLEREAEDRKLLMAIQADVQAGGGPGATDPHVLDLLDQIIKFQNQNTPGRRPVAGFTFQKKELPVATSYTIGDDEKIEVTFGCVDSLQEPTVETLPLTVTSSDPMIATASLLNETTILVQSANVVGQPLGDVQITLSDGVASTSFGVTVKAGAVAGFTFSGGAPTKISG